jgi:hypothetical protein
MSVVSLLGVNVINNPAKFTDKYEFEITFECLEPLQKGTPIPSVLALPPSFPSPTKLTSPCFPQTSNGN